MGMEQDNKRVVQPSFFFYPIDRLVAKKEG
jgi:hypothetical protein